MTTRRTFLASCAAASASPALLARATGNTTTSQTAVTVRPYRWEGPYSEHRRNAPHDWRLCAEVRASWPGACQRLILRTSEVIGYDTDFLYDDHFPPSEPEGRGKRYHHIPFEWQVVKPDQELFAGCAVPQKGSFSLRLSAHQDFVDIHLGVQNRLKRPMEDFGWSFCIVGFESPSIADSEQSRTYLFDGTHLRTLAEIAGRDMRIYKVAGAHGFIPIGHRTLPAGPVEARASIVIIEGVDGRHSAAVGFQQSDTIYGDAKGNKCFHADPYFGPRIESGEERTLRGRLYLTKGNAEEALKRYRQDFSA